MEDVGELPPLPPRRPRSLMERIRRFYARNYYDIFEGLILFWVGLMMIIFICLVLEVLK